VNERSCPRLAAKAREETAAETEARAAPTQTLRAEEGRRGGMSRSGYGDCDCDEANANLYRANTDRAFAGKRGQAFLKEMLAAMDAMPEKRLIAYGFEVTEDLDYRANENVGDVCALGTVSKSRGIKMPDVDPEDTDYAIGEIASKRLGIAECMAREIMYMNDEFHNHRKTETPEERFVRMRKWIEKQIRKEEGQP
jgi:hypothetical protein